VILDNDCHFGMQIIGQRSHDLCEKEIDKILSRLDREFEFMTIDKRPRDLENLALI
jgi:hypothetical protein